MMAAAIMLDLYHTFRPGKNAVLDDSRMQPHLHAPTALIGTGSPALRTCQTMTSEHPRSQDDSNSTNIACIEVLIDAS